MRGEGRGVIRMLQSLTKESGKFYRHPAKSIPYTIFFLVFLIFFIFNERPYVWGAFHHLRHPPAFSFVYEIFVYKVNHGSKTTSQGWIVVSHAWTLKQRLLLSCRAN